MKYLHTMIRVKDLDASMHFYCDVLGLKEVKRYDSEKGRFSLIYLAAPDDLETAKISYTPTIELTYNWDSEDYQGSNLDRTAATRRSTRPARAVAFYAEYWWVVISRTEQC